MSSDGGPVVGALGEGTVEARPPQVPRGLALGATAVSALLLLSSLWLGQNLATEDGGPGREMAADDSSDGEKDCLNDVAPHDIRPGRMWRSSWRRLDSSDCRPGSWLTRYSEPGQSLADYTARAPNLRAGPLRIGVGQLGTGPPSPDGEATPLLSPSTAQFLSLYFGQARVQELEVTEGPATHSQVADADELLARLASSCPEGVEACLFGTAQPLRLEGLDYILGLGKPSQRTALISTDLLRRPMASQETGAERPARRSDRLRRELRVAVHEVGHLLGLGHCRHYRGCVMGGSGSLDESDMSRLMLCPLDYAKLSTTLSWREHTRWTQLAGFARKHGLHREAAYWQRFAENGPRYPYASGAQALD